MLLDISPFLMHHAKSFMKYQATHISNDILICIYFHRYEPSKIFFFTARIFCTVQCNFTDIVTTWFIESNLLRVLMQSDTKSN